MAKAATPVVEAVGRSEPLQQGQLRIENWVMVDNADASKCPPTSELFRLEEATSSSPGKRRSSSPGSRPAKRRSG